MFPLDETMSKYILLVLECRRGVDSDMEAFSRQFKYCVAGPARHPPAAAAAGPANISTAEAEAKAEKEYAAKLQQLNDKELIDAATLSDISGRVLLDRAFEAPIDRTAFSNAIIKKLADILYVPRMCITLSWRIQAIKDSCENDYEDCSPPEKGAGEGEAKEQTGHSSSLCTRTDTTTLTSTIDSKPSRHRQKRRALITYVLVKRGDEEEDEATCFACGDPCVDADVMIGREANCIECLPCYLCRRCSVATKNGRKCLWCISEEELEKCSGMIQRRAALIRLDD